MWEGMRSRGNQKKEGQEDKKEKTLVCFFIFLVQARANA